MSDERSAGEIDRRLGARIRARRLELGMSQERLAEMLGVTFQQVQKYEKGKNRIAASRLVDVSRALDLPISQIFMGIEAHDQRSKKDGVGASEALATAGAAELVILYASIKSIRLRRRVLELVRAVCGGEA